ncbi:hypothetical protein DFH09DRAFT_1451465 [Mycena vulgaris]|nr:hypothetical protein DFH09DRAFT_1451465 [Mycena vulgaris]
MHSTPRHVELALGYGKSGIVDVPSRHMTWAEEGAKDDSIFNTAASESPAVAVSARGARKCVGGGIIRASNALPSESYRARGRMRMAETPRGFPAIDQPRGSSSRAWSEERRDAGGAEIPPAEEQGWRYARWVPNKKETDPLHRALRAGGIGHGKGRDISVPGEATATSASIRLRSSARGMEGGVETSALAGMRAATYAHAAVRRAMCDAR